MGKDCGHCDVRERTADDLREVIAYLEALDPDSPRLDMLRHLLESAEQPDRSWSGVGRMGQGLARLIIGLGLLVLGLLALLVWALL